MSSNISTKQKLKLKLKFSKKHLAYFIVVLGFSLLASINFTYAYNQAKQASNYSEQAIEPDAAKLNSNHSEAESSTDGQESNHQGGESESSESSELSESSSKNSQYSQVENSVNNSTSNSPSSAGKTEQNQPSQPEPSPVASSNVTVNLSVNGSNKGSLSLSPAANQCDVLSSALASGIISSLEMRYNSNFGSMGVYVIDGLGDSSSVWWTYTVNGKSPPLGCSGIKVHPGDNINWQYVKN